MLRWTETADGDGEEVVELPGSDDDEDDAAERDIACGTGASEASEGEATERLMIIWLLPAGVVCIGPAGTGSSREIGTRNTVGPEVFVDVVDDGVVVGLVVTAPV